MSELVDASRAVELLLGGSVVGVPTDTVYGLAARLADGPSVAALFSLKRRPATVALPVMVESVAALVGLGATWTERCDRLARAFWPGALTVVVRTPADLARRVGSADSTIGFRVPADEVLLEILGRTGPLVVSSANDHGEAPAESAAAVSRAFSGRPGFAGVLDGGERRAAVSTVVLVEGDSWRLVREGSISRVELEQLLDEPR
jgi:L-threonylcarbamoyladenylate synthase